MTNKKLLDEAETLSKLVMQDKVEDAMDRFSKFSLREQNQILFILHMVHIQALKAMENHPLLKL